MFFSIMYINNLQYPYQSFIQLLIQNPLGLVKGIIGYAQQDASLNDNQTTKYCFDKITEIVDFYTSNYLTQGTSETLKKLYCLNLSKQWERKYKSKQTIFTIPFDVSIITETDKKLFTIFNFEHTKLTRTKFKKISTISHTI